MSRCLWAFWTTMGIACGDTPEAPADALLLTVDVAAETRLDLSPMVAVTARQGPAPSAAPAPGECSPADAPGRPLDRHTEVVVEVGDRLPLMRTRRGHQLRFGVLDRDLSWSPVALSGAAPGGWMVDEPSAAQVPEAPSIEAIDTRWWGAVDLYFDPGSTAPTSVWVDAPGGAWRCGVGAGFIRVPAWLTRGDAARVHVEQAREDRHVTPDGHLVVGVARVRVPAAAALAEAPLGAGAVAGLGPR